MNRFLAIIFTFGDFIWYFLVYYKLLYFNPIYCILVILISILE